jgi:hypothetical protein
MFFDLVIAIFVGNVAISIGCWWLVWQLIRARRWLVAVEIITIEQTARSIERLTDVRTNLRQYREQVKNFRQIYNLRMSQIDRIRQLIYLLSIIKSIVRR